MSQSPSNAYEFGVEGIKAIESGDFKRGIHLLKQARKLEPEQYDYAFEIGRAYLENGEARTAEKHLYPLQYHVNVQPDLYILLSRCYYELNEVRKTPDETRKKELDALRYGIEKFPNSGRLYNELGIRKLELDQPVNALSVFENGIVNAPDHPENYFWAAKLMKATGNELWTWIYAEVFYNMTDDEEMRRTSGLLIREASQKVFSENWNPEPEAMDQDLRSLLSSKCVKGDALSSMHVNERKCLMDEWGDTPFPISVLIKRMELLQQKGFLDAYLASIYLETNKETFLSWLAENAEQYDAYVKWRYWNPISIDKPLKRI